MEADAIFYCTREEATSAIISLRENLEALCLPPEDAKKIYNVKINEVIEYSEIPNLVSIGKWLQDSNQGFFAEPTTKKVKMRRLKSAALFLKGGYISIRRISF